MREQLTFYPEPVAWHHPGTGHAWRDGFVFGKDVGGDEFWQLYWFDVDTRATTLLTDGKRSQNGGTAVRRDGRLLAYASTARNGTDRDIWIRDTRTGATPCAGHRRRQLERDGFLAGRPRAAGDEVRVRSTRVYPGEVDLASGKLELFPVDGGKAAFGGFRFAPDGKAVYFVSDEPWAAQEFRTLRYHDPASGELEVLSGTSRGTWAASTIADDGRHLAFASNEDGISKLHVLILPGHRGDPLPALPIGVIGGLASRPTASAWR